MFSQSIRRKIIGIALGLVVLMVATSVLSMLMASRVGHLLDELTNKYVPAYGDVALARIDSRIEAAVTDVRRFLNEDNDRLIGQLEARDFAEVQRSLGRVDALRAEFSQKIDQIRADMLAQVYASAATVMADQQRAIWVAVIVTAIAAILGLLFAGLVSTGITRPVRLLLEGTREVEAGQLDRSINVITRDEIGQLSAAFNRMVDQLRHKERIRETF